MFNSFVVEKVNKLENEKLQPAAGVKEGDRKIVVEEDEIEIEELKSLGEAKSFLEFELNEVKALLSEKEHKLDQYALNIEELNGEINFLLCSC